MYEEEISFPVAVLALIVAIASTIFMGLRRTKPVGPRPKELDYEPVFDDGENAERPFRLLEEQWRQRANTAA